MKDKPSLPDGVRIEECRHVQVLSCSLRSTLQQFGPRSWCPNFEDSSKALAASHRGPLTPWLEQLLLDGFTIVDPSPPLVRRATSFDRKSPASRECDAHDREHTAKLK